MGLKSGLPNEGNAGDAELEQALKNFRASVHSWSEAEYSRPRQLERVVRLTSWRVASGWALGCVLAAGSVTGGVFAHHHRQELAKAAAADAARQQEIASELRASVRDEELLTNVNNDVSRQVPSAMEPLAQLMDEDEAQ